MKSCFSVSLAEINDKDLEPIAIITSHSLQVSLNNHPSNSNTLQNDSSTENPPPVRRSL